MEFIVSPRGFCVTVGSLNEALFWLTMGAAEGNHEAQLWFSTYGLTKVKVVAIEEAWANQLKRIL